MPSTSTWWIFSQRYKVPVSAPTPEVSPTYLQLRSRLLSLQPAELGLSPSQQAPHVWGVLAEMGYEVGTATLVCLADGTTSLHYSTGGGLLGRGDYAPVAEAAKSLVARAEGNLQHASITQDVHLPEAGQVRFIFLTYSGIYAAEALEKTLVSGEHPLSPLFKGVQEVLGQLHFLAEKKGK